MNLQPTYSWPQDIEAKIGCYPLGLVHIEVYSIRYTLYNLLFATDNIQDVGSVEVAESRLWRRAQRIANTV